MCNIFKEILHFAKKYTTMKIVKKSLGIKIKLKLHTNTNYSIVWISLLIIQQYIHHILQQNQSTIKTTFFFIEINICLLRLFE